ncbi:MAG: hypothetical protein FWF94_03035 [Oscillospiraceae bacterium]|nr:hypothetical protein [Oscillospiraceae bacterium]
MKMTISYLVTGTWVDKQSGEVKCTLCQISSGKNKQGNEYAIADTENSKVENMSASIGDVLTYDLTPVNMKAENAK